MEIQDPFSANHNAYIKRMNWKKKIHSLDHDLKLWNPNKYHHIFQHKRKKELYKCSKLKKNPAK